MLAGSGKGWWRLANTPQANKAMNLQWFHAQGLINPLSYYNALNNERNRRGTEQVCPVV